MILLLGFLGLLQLYTIGKLLHLSYDVHEALHRFLYEEAEDSIWEAALKDVKKRGKK